MAARLTALLVVVIVGTTLIAGLIVGAQRDDNSGPVDLIIHNAKVYVADDLGSTADAVAIRGNKILKVGGEREVMRYRRPQTTVIDAHGAAVLPGFDDAHVALVAGGLAHDGVQLSGAATLDEIQSRVTAWADARPDSVWVTGSGWTADIFADQPTRAQLDAVVKDRPVRLLSQDGGSVWVNTKALQLARITRRTASPADGVIVRDRRGDATGVLKGSAMALVDRVVPKPTREERAKALEVAILDARRRGITSVQDFGASAGDLDLYDGARDAGTLSLRVYAAMPARTPIEDLEAIAKRYPDDPLLKTGLASLDGSAADLPQLVSTIDARGWQIAITAANDREVRAALDAYAAAAKHQPDAQAGRAARQTRHRIETIPAIGTDDVPRFAALGVAAVLLPLHAAGALAADEDRGVAPDLAIVERPARSLSAAGAHLAFGTDCPALPMDPLAGLRAAVKRTELHAPEQLTLKSAINAWTSGAAWASFDDHRKGTLKPGMLADIVILSTDIFGGPAKLDGAEVAMTIFDGKVVYRKSS